MECQTKLELSLSPSSFPKKGPTTTTKTTTTTPGHTETFQGQTFVWPGIIILEQSYKSAQRKLNGRAVVACWRDILIVVVVVLGSVVVAAAVLVLTVASMDSSSQQGWLKLLATKMKLGSGKTTCSKLSPVLVQSRILTCLLFSR